VLTAKEWKNETGKGKKKKDSSGRDHAGWYEGDNTAEKRGEIPTASEALARREREGKTPSRII